MLYKGTHPGTAFHVVLLSGYPAKPKMTTTGKPPSFPLP